MNTVNIIALIALLCIWSLLLVNVTLTVAGYVYYIHTEHEAAPEPERFPFVTVMVPAHNESKVIVPTVEALLHFDYPHDKYEIIVINDNSSDNTSDLLEELKSRHKGRNINVINTDAKTGGKGKSNALNIGLKQAKGEVVAIYDADNTPEREALRYLTGELLRDDRLGAVIGKFRTRNKNASLITRFINIETLSFQWMAQAGRWQLFHLCTIPGTNFVIWKSILDEIGGWDVDAQAEDTEISFRIYNMGKQIKLQPKAVTWEQEPQTLNVWFKQRTRWVKGNIYVLIKNIPCLFKPVSYRVKLDILYFMSIYFLLLAALLTSDGMFIANLIGLFHTTLAAFSMLLWLLAILMFIIGTFITVTTERGELSVSNFFLIILMYFTYTKLWMIVAATGLVKYIGDRITHKKMTWYKTERY